MKLARQTEESDTAITDLLGQSTISASLPTSLPSSIGLDSNINPDATSTASAPISSSLDPSPTNSSTTSTFFSSSSDLLSSSSSLSFSPSSTPSLSTSSSSFLQSVSSQPPATPAPFHSTPSETPSTTPFPTSYTTRVTIINGVHTTVVSPLPTALVSSSQTPNTVNRVPIIAGATAGLVFLILLALAAIFAHRRRKFHQALELSGKKKENKTLLDGEGFDDDIVPMRTYRDEVSAGIRSRALRPSSHVFIRPRAADSGSLFREEVWPPGTTRFEDPVMAGVRASSEVDLNAIVRDIMGPPVPAPTLRNSVNHTPNGSISSIPGLSSHDRTSRTVSTYSNAPLLDDQNNSVRSFYSNSDRSASRISMESGKRYESASSLLLPNAPPVPFPSGVPSSSTSTPTKPKTTAYMSSSPSSFSQGTLSVPNTWAIPGTDPDAQSLPSPPRISQTFKNDSPRNSSPLARLTSEDEKMLWLNRKLQTTPPR